jgi:formylglycine-generating enzyme required for sulfatase activity
MPKLTGTSDAGPSVSQADARTAITPAGSTSPCAAQTFDFLALDDRGALGRLGPYRVLEVMGQGGMGMVFLAEDPALDRHVALKIMLASVSANPDNKERFLREARATAQIEHDHIVTIYQVGEDRGVPYLAMQLLKGQSLEDWLRQGNRPSIRHSLRIAREIALGLAAAHDHGLIHRDIKPANIWLENRNQKPGRRNRGAGSPGRVKILDFGLARAIKDDTQITREGAVLGTPSYMAPEQAGGRAVDGRSDLFSLGCVLYRLTTGALPFPGADCMAILCALIGETPRPVRALNPEVPVEVAEFIERLLSKNPDGRPANARDVVAGLQAIDRGLAGRTPHAPPSLTATTPSIDVELATQPILPPAPSAGTVTAPRQGRRWLRVAFAVVLGGMLLGSVSYGMRLTGVRTRPVVVQPPDDAEPPVPALVASAPPSEPPVPVPPATVKPTPPPTIKPTPPVRPTLARAPFAAGEARRHQDEWAQFLKREVFEGRTLGMKLALIPPGEFEMGSNDESFQRYSLELRKLGKLNLPEYLYQRPAAEGPAHKVRITRPFLLGTCEVTVAQFRAFIQQAKYKTEAERAKGGTAIVEPDKLAKGKGPGAADREARKPEFTWEKPGYSVTDQHPVNNVTWHDAEEFCRWLSGRDKKTYRLPTEAEWEYACRAGTTTAWSSGDTLAGKGSPGMWSLSNSKNHAHPVAQWSANPFGLYDIHGNVAELCADYFDADYYATPHPLADPKGPPDRARGRVIRGGGFHQWPMLARSAYRTAGSSFPAAVPSVQIGFRVVCEIPAMASKQD